LLALRAHLHEACLEQDPQMARDAGLVDVELGDDVAHRPFTGLQCFDDAAAGGISQGFEG
jgi:hypothetical protein